MSVLGRSAVAAVVFASAFAAPAGAAPELPLGGCSGGEFRWTATEGAITMQPKLLTFASVGVIRDCIGGPPDITGGTFTGSHVAMSDCMHPADGPLTVWVTWSNGVKSTLWGQWPVGMVQPTVGPLDVVDGLGKGLRANMSVVYDMTPDMVMDCLGPGLRTGTGHFSGTTFG
ncbi:hypothetical protein [Nocardia arthritidis]|uniref:Uncharacterized protein n=1 Tax=Nocardia arthritidis TaxID=228602 RepID=A0A6G9YDW0_9NOCA|nr:hypothetical protein [Nocardia arthritidis]QIS11246.1 hypothetical protein F5544_16835 [Nocardia arthritidis]